MAIKTADEHGRFEYKTWVLVLASFVAVILNLLIGGYLLYLTEYGVEGGNIKSFEDAVWLAYMMISTVGFGDHYPITTLGRLVGMFCVLIGAINLGTFIAIGSGLIKTSSNVTNRQLMSVLVEHTRMMQEFEKKLQTQSGISETSHMLDKIFDQFYIYKKEDFSYGWVTSGQDSSGMLILSLELVKQGSVFKRWIQADSDSHLESLFESYREYEIKKEK
ncbi:putative TMhelix containing protein III [Vibrio phage VPMCC14]|nr:putative TMhelix containing protein III [Vibrio phage VPMCC14]